MNQWQKLNWNYTPFSDNSIGYAAVPFIGSIEGDEFDVYFSNRDNEGKSFLQRVKLALKNNSEIVVVEKADSSLLSSGPIGSFDSSGVMPCQLVDVNGEKLLYYIGWNLGTDVPFRNSIGLAKQRADGSFEKMHSGPILDRSVFDPCFVASMHVIKHDNGFIMYYLSCVSWLKTPEKLEHKYHIKIAYSEDGVDWKRKGEVAIDFKDKEEYAISVPRVICEDGIYKMWYSHRGSKSNRCYKIGYAESIDGLKWERKDNHFKSDLGTNGWDSQMQCYPFVFSMNNSVYMLYNGNGYGKTGFGIAKRL